MSKSNRRTRLADPGFLNRISVRSPCSESWKDMAPAGDGGARRHCAACSRDVLDFARLTAEEIELRTEASRGRLCARLTFGPDGQLVTLRSSQATGRAYSDDMLAGFTQRPHDRRGSGVAAAVVTAMLGLAGSAQSRGSDPVSASDLAASPDSARDSTGDLARSRGTRVSGSRLASLRGWVSDLQAKPLAHVPLVLRSALDGQEFSIVTRGDGSFALASVPSGIYSLEGTGPDFEVRPVATLAISAGRDHEVQVTAAPYALRLLGEIGYDLSTLRQAFDDSELVVLATVGDSRVVHTQGNHGGVATDLRIATLLKGELRFQGATVAYHHVENLRPDGGAANVDLDGELSAGSTVLAFLAPAGGGWVPRDGDYFRSANGWRGVVALDPEGAAIYRERLESLARLDLLGPSRVNDPSQLDDLVDWLVDTTAEPLTRDGALPELRDAFFALRQVAEREGGSLDGAAQALREAFFDFQREGGTLEEDPPPALLAAFLSEIQRERLLEALVEIERVAYEHLQLFDLVVAGSPLQSPQADDTARAARAWLLERARTLTEDPAAMFDQNLWSAIAERLGDPDLSAAVGELSEEANRLRAQSYTTDDPIDPEAERVEWEAPTGWEDTAELRVRQALDRM